MIYQNPGDQDGPCIGHQMPGREKMVVLLPFLDCHLHHWSSQCSHCQSVQLGPPQKGGKYFFHFQSDIFGREESMNMEKGGRTVAFWLVAPTVQMQEGKKEGGTKRPIYISSISASHENRFLTNTSPAAERGK